MSLVRQHGTALLAAACLTVGAGVGGAVVTAVDASGDGQVVHAALAAQTTAKGPKGDRGPAGPQGPAA
jgi:hypothetical protein